MAHASLKCPRCESADGNHACALRISVEGRDFGFSPARFV